MSLYGFGKLGAKQHHYFENRTKVEYGYRECWLLLPSLLSAQPPPHPPLDASRQPPCASLRQLTPPVREAMRAITSERCGVSVRGDGRSDDYTAEQLLYRDLVSGSPVHVLSDAVQLPPVAMF